MEIGVKNHPAVVDVIGEAAFEMLCRGGCLKVLALVSQATYLINEEKEILWLAASTIPLHRRCVQLHVPLPRPPVGTEFQIDAGSLSNESGDEIYFLGSTIWKTPPTAVENFVPLSTLSGLLLDTYLYFIDWPKPACLAGLIPSISGLLSHPGNPIDSGDSPKDLEPYWPWIKGMIRACFAGDFGLLIGNAAGLVGLGPGLTPSGDDFLGGFLFALQMLTRMYAGLSKLQTWDYSDFLLDSKSRTHIISYTLLKDHAAGFTVEPLHSFANNLFAGEPVEKTLGFARKLVTIGHSTGWDLLIGFLAGMSVIYE